MRILLTNDDGIHARGLAALEQIANEIGDEVWVCAPETDQSGLAHSLTLSEPLRLRKVAERKFALKGTPTDCVIMGVRELMPEPPDLILSGVNSGQNIADDVTYSGTVAGAIEGSLLGIRSIALSQGYNFEGGERHIRWETVESLAPEIIRQLCDTDFPPRTLLNVNFPNCGPDEVEGVEVTRQGSFTHGLHLEKRHDGRNFPYYWIRFARSPEKDQREGTDIQALIQKRISITPLKLDLTDQAYRDTLAAKFNR